MHNNSNNANISVPLPLFAGPHPHLFVSPVHRFLSQLSLAASFFTEYASKAESIEFLKDVERVVKAQQALVADAVAGAAAVCGVVSVWLDTTES